MYFLSYESESYEIINKINEIIREFEELEKKLSNLTESSKYPNNA